MNKRPFGLALLLAWVLALAGCATVGSAGAPDAPSQAASGASHSGSGHY